MESGQDSGSSMVPWQEVAHALKRKTTPAQKWMKSCPKETIRSIIFLKSLHQSAVEKDAEFKKEYIKLKRRYEKLFKPLYEKRSAIIQGLYEPKDEECDYPLDEEKLLEGGFMVNDKFSIDWKLFFHIGPGIPDFWLRVFKKTPLLAQMILEADEPVLRHLYDVRLRNLADPTGFILEFLFSPNQHFRNTILTMEYRFVRNLDKEDLPSSLNEELYEAKGCKIHWKGRYTYSTVIPGSEDPQVRRVVLIKQYNSFFDFFSPPAMPENLENEEVKKMKYSALQRHFHVGNYLKTHIIPRAVDHFTGEAFIKPLKRPEWGRIDTEDEYKTAEEDAPGGYSEN